MDWQIATQTHRGNVRQINEDALLVEKRYPLLAVADGMGGHEAGDVASRLLVERLAGLDLANQLQEAAAQLESSIVECNSLLIEYARQRLNGQTIGCTVVAMVAHEDRGACLWAGDSRLYRARDGSLHQVTRDQAAEVVGQRALLRGVLVESVVVEADARKAIAVVRSQTDIFFVVVESELPQVLRVVVERPVDRVVLHADVAAQLVDG